MGGLRGRGCRSKIEWGCEREDAEYNQHEKKGMKIEREGKERRRREKKDKMKDNMGHLSKGEEATRKLKKEVGSGDLIFGISKKGSKTNV